MVGVAIIGAGCIGSVHCNRLSQIPQAKILYILDNEIEKAKSLAQKYGGKSTCNLSDVLNDKNVDCVIHALPTYERLKFIEEYIKYNKHIFCEKPLARTLDEADKIFSLLKNYKKQVQVGHVLRYFYEYKTIRDLIKNNSIGNAGIARLSRCGGFPVGANGWYADYEKSGGVALDLIIHDFDWLLWTFGRADRITAKGLLNKKISKTDYVLSVIHFKNGIIAHVEGSWAEPAGTFWTSVEISGSGGIIEYDSRAQNPLAVTYKGDGEKIVPGTVVPESPSDNEPYLIQMKEFISCAENNKKPSVGIKEGLEVLKVSIAALKSIELNGEPIKII